jgi:serine/threonine protein phosphatase PrpC
LIPSEQSHMHIAAKSHPGMSGKNNEDRYAVSAYRMEAGDSLPAIFAVVSDGIGGHRAGEIAAEIIVETTSQVVASSDGSQPIQTLKEAVRLANQKILSYSEREPETKGMGATCSCCWIIDDSLYIAYVGDTRIYLLREDSIIQISTDHTWIQEALDAGVLTPEQAKRHPNAHVIRRFLGSDHPVQTDIRLKLDEWESDSKAENNQGMRLRPGDQVLLCSDGLTDLVNAPEILNILKENSQEQALDNLINLANQRGGHDNITIIAVKSPEIDPEPAAPHPAASDTKKRIFLTCLTASILAAVVLILVASAYFFFRQYLNPPATPITTITTTQPALFPSETHTPVESQPPNLLTATDQPIETTVESPATITPWPTNTTAP